MSTERTGWLSHDVDQRASTTGRVVAVSRSAAHRFSKVPVERVTLVAGKGVDGDCHAGESVQHQSRVRRDPTQPNLRQVHLLAAELLIELDRDGFEVGPGDLGENLTTEGVDLLALPRGTRLTVAAAVLEITGLRNPCWQLDRFRPGLLSRVLGRADDGRLVRRAGVMAIVITGGVVAEGDAVEPTLPPAPHQPLAVV